MGDYSIICALSGLPISRNDRVKKIILRSSQPDNLYWVPELSKGWKPLLLPVTGYYRNCMGSIEDVEKDEALVILYHYFQSSSVFCVNLKEHGYHPEIAYDRRYFKNNIIKSLLRKAEEGQQLTEFLESQKELIETFPFQWREDDWDDFCIQLVEQQPIHQIHKSGPLADEPGHHSYCLVLDEVFQWVINLMEPSRKFYTDQFHRTLNDFLCPTFPWFNLVEREGMGEISSSEEWFAKGGKTVFEEEKEIEYLEAKARCLRGYDDQFMETLSEAMEQAETAYVVAAETKKPELIKAIVDMILLSVFTGRFGIQHVWHPIRTHSIYEQQLQEVFIPWNKFKMELAERRYQTWYEEYGPEED